MNEYPQERFGGLSASEVREAAKRAESPAQYPIKENKKIEKYKEELNKKATSIANAMKVADL